MWSYIDRGQSHYDEVPVFEQPDVLFGKGNEYV